MIGRRAREIPRQTTRHCRGGDRGVSRRRGRKLNDAQRVILIAEDYDFEVLIAAKWLTEQYGADVRCYRLALSSDGVTEYANCTCIYPPPELTKYATARGGNGVVKPLKWSDWDAALAAVENSALVTFFKKELAGRRDNYLRKRILRFKVERP
jgi:hypothetical protein